MLLQQIDRRLSISFQHIPHSRGVLCSSRFINRPSNGGHYSFKYVLLNRRMFSFRLKVTNALTNAIPRGRLFLLKDIRVSSCSGSNNGLICDSLYSSPWAPPDGIRDPFFLSSIYCGIFRWSGETIVLSNHCANRFVCLGQFISCANYCYSKTTDEGGRIISHHRADTLIIGGKRQQKKAACANNLMIWSEHAVLLVRLVYVREEEEVQEWKWQATFLRLPLFTARNPSHPSSQSPQPNHHRW